MQTRNILQLITGFLCLGIIASSGCKKIEEGFISDRIVYPQNPFYIQQGITAVSASLVADGSTAPLHVQVLSLKDSAGNDADSLLTTPRSIVTFTGAITYLDSTLDLLKLKLKDSLVSPFNIAELGGRLQFTAATKFIPTGSYNLDVAVSNVRGTRVLQNACNFIIQPVVNTFNLLYQRLIYYDSVGAQLVYNDQAGIADIRYTATGTSSKVIFKWVDKNNRPFNPAKGEVLTRANRPSFKSWDPYYSPVYTDSTIEAEFPNLALSFPFFQTAKCEDGSLWTDVSAITYYRVLRQAIVENQDIYSTISTQLLTSGTYNITIHMNGVTRK